MLLTRAPVAGWREQALSTAAPRLACVKPVASVHPEPGSNSPLLVIFFSFLSISKKEQKSNLNLVCCCLHGRPASMTARRPADPDRIGCLRWFEDIDKSSCRLNLFSDRSSVFSNLYYFVYCKNFNVLCGSALEPKAFAKLRHFFGPPKSLLLF